MPEPAYLAIHAYRLTPYIDCNDPAAKRRIKTPVWSSVAWVLHNPCQKQAVDNLSFKWATDTKGMPWIVHQCHNRVDTWQVPYPRWTQVGGVLSLPVDCHVCGLHGSLGPDDTTTMPDSVIA